jgi:predicted secreted protein
MIHGAVLVSAFVIFWFLALFVLLPMGIGAADPETGAPHYPMLRRKAAYATVVAAVLWCIFYALIAFKVVEL